MNFLKSFTNLTLILLFINLPTINVFAQSVTLCIKGVVVYVDDHQNTLNGGIALNDSLKGTISYDLNIPEDNTHGNTVPQVGDYYNLNSPSGVIVKINNYKFQTDTNNVNFLVEVINNYENSDNITMHSYNNIFPPALSILTSTHIGWQLDDFSQTALTTINIPTSINLAAWPWLPNQSTGFTITGQNDNNIETTLFIRTKITEVKTCSASERNTTVESVPNKLTVYPNPIAEIVTIEVDTTLIGSTYIISDQMGKELIHGILKNEKTTITTSQLAKGEYQVKVGNSRGLSFKVIKN